MRGWVDMGSGGERVYFQVMTDKELRSIDLWIAEHLFGFSGAVEVARGRSLKGVKDEKDWHWAWRKSPESQYNYTSYVLRDGARLYLGKPFEIYFSPYYTLNPAAAMMVLEKCGEKTVQSECMYVGKIDDEWQVGLAELHTEAVAKTLPLAIALFAKALFSK